MYQKNRSLITTEYLYTSVFHRFVIMFDILYDIMCCTTSSVSPDVQGSYKETRYQHTLEFIQEEMQIHKRTVNLRL